MARKIIEQLASIPGLKIECPKCSGIFAIKRAKPFSMYAPYPPAALKILSQRLVATKALNQEIAARNEQLVKNLTKKPMKIAVGSEASNFGKISEQILPAFLTFPYQQAECRVLLQPIDYVVFKGLSKRDHVEAIKFVEVKTGAGRLDRKQQQIRNCVVDRKIKHKVIDYERPNPND
jgi:predicted Holliday junction resolvase-like endonuclease